MGKATEWHVLNFSRPHSRGFHFAALSFFTAFFIWFAIAPLMPEIKKTLGLTKQQYWTTNIVSVSGTIMMRSIMGPIVDKYGPRIPGGMLLILAAIPTACLGFANSMFGLCVVRFFLGSQGGCLSFAAPGLVTCLHPTLLERQTALRLVGVTWEEVSRSWLWDSCYSPCSSFL